MAGNRVFAHALILCIASALLLAPWGTLRDDVPRPPAGPALQPIWIQADQPTIATGRAPLPPSDRQHGQWQYSLQQHGEQQHGDRQDGQRAAGGEELVFGWQGAIALGQVRIAYWAICVCLMTGALASALNFLSWTRLPSLLIFACFGFTAACALVAAIHHALLGSVGTGSVLAIACALVGLLLGAAIVRVRSWQIRLDTRLQPVLVDERAAVPVLQSCEAD